MRFKSGFIAAVVSPLAPLAMAFSMAAPSSAFASQQDEVAAVKQEIVQIAESNQLRQDNIEEVQAQLQPLIKRLVSLVPSKLEADQASLVVGGWRNLWSNMYFLPTVDLSQNYQVVSPNGFYYNVFRQTIFGQAESTDFLRGKYSDGGDHLDIEFTRNAVAPGWPAPGTKLLDIANQAESGALASYDIPGPVGVTGILKNAYVDSELRIITGGDVTGESGLLYVMTRADSIVAP